MKTETKKIEVTTYIARDGREFRNKVECADYEDYLNRESVFEDAKQHIRELKTEVTKDNLPFIPPGLLTAIRLCRYASSRSSHRCERCNSKHP